MRYIGMDVHKRVVETVVLDEAGEVVLRARLDCTREAVTAFCVQQVRPDDRLALEATTNTWAMVDLLEPFVGQIVVSNPLRTRFIAEAKVKTDRVDALVLAQLLRCDFLPSVWVPDRATRLRRHLTSRRAGLVSDRTRIKNRIHAVLHQRLLHHPTRELFCNQGRAWLEELEIDPPGRAAIDSELRLLEAVESEIAVLDQQLAENAHCCAQTKLLMTLPGVDVAAGQSLLAALGDVSRFKDGDHAASYLGIVPSTKQSAESCYHGPITKQGRGHARWMMVQAAQHVGSHPGPLGVFFRRLANKKDRNVAVVATARKLVVIAWHMLKNNEPYRYAVPRSTEAKLSKLRVKAIGKRRRGGIPKGSPRSAAYGTGCPSRAVRSIDGVYATEGLPPLQELADGERRAVEQAGVADFLYHIHASHRVPKRAKQDGE